MIPIYICEDNPKINAFIKETIEKYCLINELDFEIILATKDPFSVISNAKEKLQRSVYFLDVDLQNDKMNGFDLGKELRKIDTRGFLIYVTTHDEMLTETFKHRLEAMDYIVKDNQDRIEERIQQCLDSIQDRVQHEEKEEQQYFSVKIFSKLMHIPTDEIVFFETSSKKHVICLHTNDQLLEFQGNLQEINNQLGETFSRVHRSYLVNLEKVKTFDAKENRVIMTNGDECFISRDKKKFLRKYMQGRNVNEPI